MQIVILGTTLRENDFLEHLFEFKRHATMRGHICTLLRYGELALALNRCGDLVAMGQGLEELFCSDIVIPRLGIKKMCRGDFYLLDLLRMKGVNFLNPIEAIELARNKISSLQILHAAGLPVVPTMVTRQIDFLERTPDVIGDPPYVIKPSMGSKGADIEIAKDVEELKIVFQNRWLYDRNEIILIQPLLRTADGLAWDIRVFVLLGEVVGVMKRIAPEGDFRANYSIGGTVAFVEIDRGVESLAVMAAKTLSLDMAGVDLMITENGPVILEVNANPGWEGIAKAAKSNGDDFFDKFIDVLEENFN